MINVCPFCATPVEVYSIDSPCANLACPSRVTPLPQLAANLAESLVLERDARRRDQQAAAAEIAGLREACAAVVKAHLDWNPRLNENGGNRAYCDECSWNGGHGPVDADDSGAERPCSVGLCESALASPSPAARAILDVLAAARTWETAYRAMMTTNGASQNLAAKAFEAAEAGLLAALARVNA